MSDILPRLAADALQRTASIFPITVLTGARQTGKSAMVRDPGLAAGRPYLTLDDIAILDQATRDPEALLLRGERLVIDEVQRRPELLLTIKRAVDENRSPGRFILTGSANLLLMRQVAESLAGRAGYITIMPLTRREQLGYGTAGNWDLLLSRAPREWRGALADDSAPEEAWQDLAMRGGYPVPAYRLDAATDRTAWFEAYTTTYLERDLRQISAIDDIADFRRLMAIACLRLGGLLNQADVARDAGVAPTTAQRYLNVLETSYQMIRLSAYSVNRTKRLIKAPKLYWTDPGLALFLAGETKPRGAHLENLVLCDLFAWSAGQTPRANVMYWRTAKGAEVDFVVEAGRRLLPIEVKAGRASMADARHLEMFLAEYPEQAAAGVLLTTDPEVYWLTRRVLVVPWWKVV